jgi:FMN phosphatase YigB (HAD superfamily)
MPKPKAVVFDLGKVLLDFDYAIAIRRLLPRCRVPLDELKRTLTQQPLLLEYETGLLTTAEFYERLRAATGYQGTLAEFSAFFGDIFMPIEPMIALQAELRARGVPTFILSNTNEMAIRFVRRQYPWFAGFDGYALSYEHRSMKPAGPLYKVVERLSGLAGADLFYFDDRPENVEAAWQRGWRGLVHSDPAQSRAALVATGLLNGA